MRERINRLAKGIIDMETPALSVVPARMEEEIPAGEVIRKEIFITSENNLHSKGLVYSSNSRVTVLNGSFGGLRNHVNFEVNSRYLEYGDVIEGSFYLVTSGGEKEIPYSFRVQAGMSGRTLGQLKEPRDFAAMAKKDYEMALRIFEYRDFTQVPFMQDMHIRAVYDGLLGHGNRYGQLEQFLIALRLKEPVKLQVEDLHREYYGLDQVTDGEIAIKRSGWGYLPVTVHLDGGFIQTVKRTLAEEDFVDGVCHFPYRLSPGGLHGGKNFGSITLETVNDTIVVEFEVSSGISRAGEKDQAYPGVSGQPGMDGRFARYFSLRLDYEAGLYEPLLLQNQMMEELEQIRMTKGVSMELSLMEAELYLLAGRKEDALVFLQECRDEVADRRLQYPGYYCLYQYVLLQIQPDLAKQESLNRLLRKYLEEETGDYLIFYLYTRCEEQYCFENPGEMLTRMKVLYGEGCRSPFLYQNALRIWNDAPSLLYSMGTFELQVLNFGARKGLVGETLAVKAAKLAVVSRQYQPLALRMLKQFYEKYPQKEILEAVCSLMIRGQCRQESDFPWYEKALKEHISLTRLYEYFLYSLPSDYHQMIPKEVLLYFSYDHDLDHNSKAVLYANIIQYMKDDTPIYREYQKEMGRFAAEQILKSRIDSNLAVIYDAVIYEDMVDAPIARVLPALLKSYRISVKNPKMRQVVVCYEELTEEGVYPIQRGIAYVPVFSGKCCIMFQDAYGNRYTDVSHIKTPVLDKPGLEKKCFEVYPEHPMLLLSACRKAAEGAVEEPWLAVIERALTQLNLHPLYKSVLTGQLMEYYKKNVSGDGEEDGGADFQFMLSLDEKLLSGKQKTDFCEILISRNYIREAYGMIREYHLGISGKRMQKLCVQMILNRLFDQDDLLLKQAFSVFEQGLADSVILDYLCEHFNGSSEQMYQVLIKGVSDHVETYDLEERLLAQMLFSGKTERMDKVFALYMRRKRVSDTLVRAYFTMKSAEYFLYDVPAMDQVFQYLEDRILKTAEKDKLSAIYLLALTKYYAGLDRLTDRQKELCQEMTEILLAGGLVLPHLKKLAGQVRIPEEIMDKGMIQYIGQKDSRVDLQIRIRPQEEEFHSDEMQRVYQGIFVKQKVLFDGEVMEYRIYEQKGQEWVLMEEGAVTRDKREEPLKESRFQLLNQMTVCLSLKDEAGLRSTMEEYMKKTAVIEELFGLM